MRPLRAAFGGEYDAATDNRSLSPIREHKRMLSQEDIGMKVHHQKNINAMLTGAKKADGLYSKGVARAISTARNQLNYTQEPI